MGEALGIPWGGNLGALPTPGAHHLAWPCGGKLACPGPGGVAPRELEAQGPWGSVPRAADSREGLESAAGKAASLGTGLPLESRHWGLVTRGDRRVASPRTLLLSMNIEASSTGSEGPLSIQLG